MKILKVPGQFHLPKYEVLQELELALREGLDNVNTPMVNYLKQLIKKSEVPKDDLALCFSILLTVERHFENEEINKLELFDQSPVCDKDLKCFKISVPDLNVDDPFTSDGNFVCLNDNVSKTTHVLLIVDFWNGHLIAKPVGPKKYVCN